MSGANATKPLNLSGTCENNRCCLQLTAERRVNCYFPFIVCHMAVHKKCHLLVLTPCNKATTLPVSTRTCHSGTCIIRNISIRHNLCTQMRVLLYILTFQIGLFSYPNESRIRQVPLYLQSTPVISKPDITKYPLISKWDYIPPEY